MVEDRTGFSLTGEHTMSISPHESPQRCYKEGGGVVVVVRSLV